MEIQVDLQLMSLHYLINQIFNQYHLRKHYFGGGSELAIEIFAWSTASWVTENYAVWIEHWNYYGDDSSFRIKLLLSEVLGLLAKT